MFIRLYFHNTCLEYNDYVNLETLEGISEALKKKHIECKRCGAYGAVFSCQKCEGYFHGTCA